AVHGVQGLQADRAQGDEQDDDGEERHQELRVDPHREPRDEPDQPALHRPLASMRRLRTSASSSSGSNRTPRYCTRSTPSRSMSDVRKVWSTSPPGLFRTLTPYRLATSRISLGVPVRNAQPAAFVPCARA